MAVSWNKVVKETVVAFGAFVLFGYVGGAVPQIASWVHPLVNLQNLLADAVSLGAALAVKEYVLEHYWK